MKKHQLRAVVLTKNDPTAWQLARREGKSFKDYCSMVFTIMGSLVALIVIASKFDKPMHDPVIGLLGTATVIFIAWKLFKEFDRRYG